MKPVHLSHSVIVLILLLVTITFLIGSMRAFGTAHAAESVAQAAMAGSSSPTSLDPTPTPESNPPAIPGDTIGIISLAIIIVIIVVINAALGNNRSGKHISLKKKP
jgi:hypothetical protein